MKKTIVSFISLLSFCGCLHAGTSKNEVVAPSKAEATSTDKKDEKLRAFFDASGNKLQFILACLKYEYVKEMSDEEILEKAAEGVLSTLDPHTCYLNEKTFKAMMEQSDGEFGGIGIEITVHDGAVHIISPIDDTPADKAGLRSGDMIIGIDDEYVSSITGEEAVERLRGKPGTTVKLKVKRGEKAPFDVSIKRDKIKVESVKTEVLDKVGYIRISVFDKNTTKGVREFLEKNKSLEGIVIDVRNNPGGLLSAAVEVSNLFLSGGEIVSIKGRTPGNSETFSADKTDVSNGVPLVVLINNGTASAPEILTGALKDHKRAIVVGTRSFGKGSVQKVIPMSEKTGIKITIARYYTPNGTSIQVRGLTPDIIAESVMMKKPYSGEMFREEFFDNALDNEDRKKKHPNAKKLFESDDKKDKDEKKEEEEYFKFRNLPLKERLEKDYQLAKAFDVLKTIDVYKQITEGKK